MNPHVLGLLHTVAELLWLHETEHSTELISATIT